MRRPTLAEVSSWPATVPLHDPNGGPDLASALGLGRSAVYEANRRGDLPVTPLRCGRKLLVPLGALLHVLNAPRHGEERE